METKELTTQESLSIITDMIGQAKHNVAKGDSFQILFWGWIIAIANLGHYVLAKSGYDHPYVVWLLVVPAIVISVFYGIRMNKKQLVRTHMDKIYAQIWIGAFIVFIITVSFMFQLNFHHNPVILAVAGLGMYITGWLLRFKPVVFGAVCLWIGAIVAFTLPVTDQYLVGSISILVGYIVPGYLLKRAEN